MNPHNPTDLRTLILEVLTDTRLLALIQYWCNLPSRKQKLLLRLTRALK